MLLGKPQCHAQMPAQLALSSKLLKHISKVGIPSLSQLTVQEGGCSANIPWNGFECREAGTAQLLQEGCKGRRRCPEA